MKNIWLLLLSFGCVFLVSCNSFSIDSNMSSPKNTTSSSSTTTKTASDYISPFTPYKSYSQNVNIELMLNGNPIDKKYILDEKTLLKQPTFDELALVSKYIVIWDNEMKSVLKDLQTNLSGDALNTLNDSQTRWELFVKKDGNLATQIQLETAGTGSVIPILDALKYLDAVRQRTLGLAEYYYMKTGEFQFVFH